MISSICRNERSSENLIQGFQTAFFVFPLRNKISCGVIAV
ncbi:hypothetical protein HMPREF3156_02911 [Neisseria sp. HMSC06F02]|nr:hypothetical protein HMPREF3156_02911 [Neisseria sp. HMSC06F02]